MGLLVATVPCLPWMLIFRVPQTHKDAIVHGHGAFAYDLIFFSFFTSAQEVVKDFSFPVFYHFTFSHSFSFFTLIHIHFRPWLAKTTATKPSPTPQTPSSQPLISSHLPPHSLQRAQVKPASQIPSLAELPPEVLVSPQRSSTQPSRHSLNPISSSHQFTPRSLAQPTSPPKQTLPLPPLLLPPMALEAVQLLAQVPRVLLDGLLLLRPPTICLLLEMSPEEHRMPPSTREERSSSP